jgi:membrane-associated protein
MNRAKLEELSDEFIQRAMEITKRAMEASPFKVGDIDEVVLVGGQTRMPKIIEEVKKFFDKYGGKTIILARFVPIVRTFAPFVAGVGKMHYSTFISFNIIGGTAWVMLFTLAGFFFGNIPTVKHNFTLVIFAIIGLSVLPMIVEAIKIKMSKSK